MATKSKKRILGYTIFTTSELNQVIYLANDFTIQGSFIIFEPQCAIEKGKKTELKGAKFTLPERVIREIIYQEIDERDFQKQREK